MVTSLEVKQWGLGYATIAHFPDDTPDDCLAMRDTEAEAIAYATPLLITLNVQAPLITP